jgi:hypothetical protein
LIQAVILLFPYLDGHQFDSETKRIMGITFELTRATLHLEDRTDPIVAIIAKRIIELAKAASATPIITQESARSLAALNRPVAADVPGTAAHCQAMSDFSERGSLDVRQLQPPFQLGPQDAVFSDQIFVLRQQLLVHRPCDVGQDARPIHSSSTPAGSRFPQKSLPALPGENRQLTVFSTVSIL